MSFTRLVPAGLLIGAASIATPAFAQDDTTYFDGPYIAGSVSLDQVDDGSNDSLIFDTDQNGTYGDVVSTAAGANAFAPGFCNGIANGPTAAAGCSNDDNDIGYSLRVGYDKRINGGPFVAGVMLEGSKPGATDYTTAFSTTPASYTVAREIDWSGALRGRLGYSPGDGRGLFYVTGGVGYAKIDHDFITTNTANSFTEVDDGDWKFGTQLGAGAELMLTKNIGIGMEYLYSRYNDDDYHVVVGQGDAGATSPFVQVSDGTNLTTSDSKFDMHSLRATVSVHF